MKDLKNHVRTLSLAGAVLTAPFTMAQDHEETTRKDPESFANARTQRITEELGLSSEQAERIRAIHMQQADKMREVRSMEDLEARKAAMHGTRKAKQEAIRAVLTPEQQAKAEALRKAKSTKGDRERMDPEAHANLRTERMTKELGLTAEQAGKVKAIHLRHMDRMREAEGVQDEARRKEIKKDIMRSQQDEVRAVLTAEQQTRWEELRKEHKRKHGERHGKRGKP